MTLFCEECGIETNANFKFCSECNEVCYCDRNCQKKNWKIHKIICNFKKNDNVCVVCLERIYDKKRTIDTCKHLYHESCYSELNLDGICPLCDSGKLEKSKKLYFSTLSEFIRKKTFQKNYDDMDDDEIKFVKSVLDRLEESSNLGNLMATYILGRFYCTDVFIKKNYEKAIEFFNIAANLNYDKAKYELAVIYLNDNYLDYDYEYAFKLLKESAENNYYPSNFKLAYLYEKGIFVEKSYEKSLEYLKIAEELGSTNATLKIGDYYKNGYVYQENLSLAFKYYLTAASKNNYSAFYNIGCSYFYGDGVHKNFKIAFRWFKLAADNNISSAINKIGIMYEKGYGVETNYNLAETWYKNAIKKGFIPASSNLALLYYNQYITFENSDKIAFELLEDVYQKNNCKDYLYFLGNMCLHGFGVDRDIKKGLKLYRRAAYQGDSYVQNKLGLIFLNGDFGIKRYKTALYWFRMAADKDNIDGQFNMGYMHMWGLGVIKNKEEAYRWWKLAANNGDEGAMKNLKKYFSKGN